MGSSTQIELFRKIKSHQVQVCVLGLGYIGLPTASMFATHGLDVLGVDVNQDVVEILNQGDIHLEEPGLKTIVQAAIGSGNLKISNQPGISDVFIIAVPTPITPEKKADMSYVVAAIHLPPPDYRGPGAAYFRAIRDESWGGFPAGVLPGAGAARQDLARAGPQFPGDRRGQSSLR